MAKLKKRLIYLKSIQRKNIKNPVVYTPQKKENFKKRIHIEHFNNKLKAFRAVQTRNCYCLNTYEAGVALACLIIAHNMIETQIQTGGLQYK